MNPPPSDQRERPQRNVAEPPGDGAAAVLVLYHSVGGEAPDGSRRFSVGEEQFRRHLEVIKAAIANREAEAATLADWWAGRHSRPAVVVCFDDGGLSDYERALPLLLEAGVPATFFINPGLIGSRGYLDWPQVSGLMRAGMEIESHGFDHRALNALPANALERQLRRARHSLQEHTGKPVQFLAAPYGEWNRRVLEAALATGHKALCISRPGVVRHPRPVLARIGVRSSTSARQLQGWLRGRSGSIAGLWIRDRALWLPKRILSTCRPNWTGPEPRPDPSGVVSRFTS